MNNKRTRDFEYAPAILLPQSGRKSIQWLSFEPGSISRLVRKTSPAPFRHDITYDVSWHIFLLAGATSFSAHSSGASPLRSDFLLWLDYDQEMGLTKWAEFAVFKGFQPNELIFGTEFGLLTKEPYLLSVGFVNWSPHSNVDPQPFIEAGYYTEHHKFIAGAIHAGYKNEAILGYAYDFNKTWRAQVDFQSGSENSATIGFTCNITRDFQMNPALYVANDHTHDLLGYVVFTYTFHLWGDHDK